MAMNPFAPWLRMMQMAWQPWLKLMGGPLLLARAGDDVAPRFLPDGRIVFLSTRRGQSLQVGRESAARTVAPVSGVSAAKYLQEVRGTAAAGLRQDPFECFTVADFRSSGSAFPIPLLGIR